MMEERQIKKMTERGWFGGKQGGVEKAKFNLCSVAVATLAPLVVVAGP